MNMTRERWSYIMEQVYPELSEFEQSFYNGLGCGFSETNNHWYHKYIIFKNKVKSIKDITEEESNDVINFSKEHYLFYTDHLDGGHGNIDKINSELYIKTPAIKQAWKEYFTK